MVSLVWFVLWFSFKLKWLLPSLDTFDRIWSGLHGLIYTIVFSDLEVCQWLSLNPDMVVYSSSVVSNIVEKFESDQQGHACYAPLWFYRLLANAELTNEFMLPNNRLPVSIDFLTVTVMTVLLIYSDFYSHDGLINMVRNKLCCLSWGKSAHFVWSRVSTNDDVAEAGQETAKKRWLL